MRVLRMRVLGALSCCLLPLLAQDPRSAAKHHLRTVRELAKQGSEAIPQLQVFLSDPAPEVRVEAVKAIIEIDTQHSLEPLIQATGDADPEVQIRATDGLVNFYLPGYVHTGLGNSLRRVGTVIKSKFTDTTDQVIDPYIKVRPEVIQALGKLARGSASMDARANALRALGILRGAAAVPDVVEALRSSKTDQVIFEGLIALQKIADPAAAPNIAFLLQDLDDKVQVAALETTGLLRNREALPRLREALGRARNDKIRRAALEAIAFIPDQESRPLYTRYFTDRDDRLRAAAAEGLARLKSPADLPMIEKAFEEERKMPPRLALAFALVMLGKAEVSEFSPLQYLVNTLNAAAWRGVAQAYLVELSRQPTLRRSLQEATRQGTKDEKIQLAQILAQTGDKDTVPYLDALSRDGDTDVAEEGIIALKTLKARLP